MKHLLLLTLLAAPAALLPAQTEQTIIDRSQQPAAPTLPPGQPAPTAVSPGDADAGNQRIAETRKLPIKLYVAYDAQVYNTSNVNLDPDTVREQDAVIVANTLALRADFKSWAVGEALLTPSVGFNFQRFYHGVGSSDHEALDFDAYSVPLALRYRFGANWEATLGFTSSSVYSLEGPPRYHLIFRSYSPSLGLRKLISLRENQILSIGGGLSYSLTKSDRDSVVIVSPFRDDRNDKVDTSFDVSYYFLHGKWVTGPYVRFSYADYLHYQENSAAPAPAPAIDVDRRDFTGSIGLSVSYNFTPWAAARAFTSFDWRNPQGDNQIVDYGYENTNLGLGLTLSASF